MPLLNKAKWEFLMTKRKTRNEGSYTYRKKDGLWMGRYYMTNAEGKRVRQTVYGKTKNETIVKVQNALYDIRHGKISVTSNDTMKGFYEHWLSELAPKYLKETTIEMYERYFYRFILPCLGRKKICEIRLDDIQHLIDAVYRSTRSAKECFVCRDAVATVLNCARKMHKTDINATNEVILPKYRPKEKQLWSPEELQSFLCNVQNNNKKYYLLLLLISSYGLRIGEGLGLGYEDIELGTGKDGDYGTIHVRKQVTKINNRSTLSTLKTESSRRDLPITKEIYYALTKYSRITTCSEGLIFTTSSGNAINYDNFRKCFINMQRQAGAKKSITLHALRHMAATNMVNSGVDIKTVQCILGHTDPATTIKIYQHSSMDNKRKAIEGLGKVYNLV